MIAPIVMDSDRRWLYGPAVNGWQTLLDDDGVTVRVCRSSTDAHFVVNAAKMADAPDAQFRVNKRSESHQTIERAVPK